MKLPKKKTFSCKSTLKYFHYILEFFLMMRADVNLIPRLKLKNWNYILEKTVSFTYYIKVELENDCPSGFIYYFGEYCKKCLRKKCKQKKAKLKTFSETKIVLKSGKRVENRYIREKKCKVINVNG